MIIKESKHKRELIKYGTVILTSILIIAAIVVPLPYYVEVPGSAENVADVITVDKKHDKSDGSFMLTTVGIRRGTLATLLTAKVLPFQEIIAKQDLMGDSDDKEYERLSDLEMSNSENMAKKVALDLADEPYKLDYKGVYVMSVLDDSDFKDKLEPGDVIYQVDDLTFKHADEFMNYIAAKKKGDKLTIHFERDKKKQKVEGKMIELSDQKKTGIGITLIDHTEINSEREIEISVSDIGGPSAGLMFTLQLYELLAKEDLKKGREIAGTGTIKPDGSVGRIGGIDKKVVAADKMGATVFFAPNEPLDKDVKKANPEMKNNYEEAVAAAKKIKTSMKIIPVLTAEDAIKYLKEK